MIVNIIEEDIDLSKYKGRKKIKKDQIVKEKYICEVVLKQNKNATRFYLHEVTEQKKFLDRAFVTHSAQEPVSQET